MDAAGPPEAGVTPSPSPGSGDRGRGKSPSSGPSGAWRWTSHDTEILRLAVPALGSLAAGPLYVLADTAIIGRLGTAPLAGLALAGVLLEGSLALCNFLAYATTAQVGRAHGAGQHALVRRMAAQALWLASGIGLAIIAAGWIAGRGALAVLGAAGEVAELANIYLRIALLGMPFALIAQAGQGFLRGVRDLRTPLVLVVIGNVLNLILEVLFIYGFGWGIAGSAWGTVIAQTVMGGGFIARLWQASAGSRRPAFGAMRPLMRMSWEILGRTASLYASFVAFSAVLARVGAPSLAAHQVIFQIWLFLALVLDAIAIAGQVMVSRLLGQGDRVAAVEAARRMIAWSTLAGVIFAGCFLALGDLLPRAFTEDPEVLGRVAAAWPIFALTQPASGAVFALDGILIGAGDSRYLMWAMLASSSVVIPLALLALVLGWGIVGVWLALFMLIMVRLATTGARFAAGPWVVTGELKGS